MSECPLCSAGVTTAYASVDGRDYLNCRECDLVWLEPQQRPAHDEELAEYLLHENDPGDAGYRRHLSKLTDRMLPLLKQEDAGLDFGCGPGPAISVMLGELGYEVSNYDPFFFDRPKLLKQRYDFITCTEVAEHFHEPARSFALLAQLLNAGGVLGMMTRLRTPDIDFAKWFYIRERSHVVFYAPRTIEWIGERNGWQVDMHLPDVVMFSDGS